MKPRGLDDILTSLSDLAGYIRPARSRGGSLNPTAVLVDALLAAARLTVTPAEREAFIEDYPLLQARTAKLYSVGGELEPALDFNPAEFYGEELA